VIGEHYANFRAIVDAMRNAGGIEIAAAATVGGAIGELLSDPQAAREMGERGRRVFEEQAGATERTIEAIVQILDGQIGNARGAA
jgi:3-deoxy-D-manno-octulosonic-acid transferase